MSLSDASNVSSSKLGQDPQCLKEEIVSDILNTEMSVSEEKLAS